MTLLELSITCALIGILVAIGVPQLLRARLAANESSGIAALRAISSSEANYATTCGNGGYATDLADLVKPSPASGHGFLSRPHDFVHDRDYGSPGPRLLQPGAPALGRFE